MSEKIFCQTKQLDACHQSPPLHPPLLLYSVRIKNQVTHTAQTKTVSMIILFLRCEQSILFSVRPRHILHASVYPTTPLLKKKTQKQ